MFREPNWPTRPILVVSVAGALALMSACSTPGVKQDPLQPTAASQEVV